MEQVKDIIGTLQAHPGQAVVFIVLAGAVILGALLTITRRNPVAAVMSLVFTFFALAAVYATLSAHFLAVLQVSVYAGAIMVLFIFVVMILNRDEVSPVSMSAIFMRPLGVLASGFLFLTMARLVMVTRAQPLLAAVASGAPADSNYGTVATVGASLFKDFVFPFEAISLLLLVAVVGGVVVSRSSRQEEEAVEEARRQNRVRASIRPESRVGAGEHINEGAGHGAAHH